MHGWCGGKKSDVGQNVNRPWPLLNEEGNHRPHKSGAAGGRRLPFAYCLLPTAFSLYAR
jgi:hypothetical protein